MSDLIKCPLPWTQTFVDVNKSLSPCCAPLELGSLNDNSIQQIYNGQPYQDLRNALSSKQQSLITANCDNCYSWNKMAQGAKNFDDIYPVGSNTNDTLNQLEQSHPEFVNNYRAVKNQYLNGTGSSNTDLKPLKIELQIGEHCDIACIMCWQDHKKPRALKKKNLEEVYQLIPYLLEITVTGGEPTIFPDFWKLIKLFKAHSMPFARLQLLTHGQHIAANLEQFEGIPYIGFCVNVDGPNKELYEKIRKGSNWNKLNESLSALKIACQKNPGWGLNTTFLLMKSNIEHIEESIHFANKFNASWSCGLLVGEYTPIDQCRSYFSENIFSFDHLGFSKEKIVSLLENSIKLAQENDRIIGINAASASIRASIDEVLIRPQIHVADSEAQTLMQIDDSAVLSRAIKRLLDVNQKQLFEGSDPSIQFKASSAINSAEQSENDGDYKHAAQQFKLGLALYNSINFELEAIETQIKYARCLLYSKPKKALKILEQSASELELNFGKTHSKVALAELELGKAMLYRKHFQNAESHLLSAYRTLTLLFGKQEFSSYIAVSAYHLGKTYQEQGSSKATPLLRKSLRMFENLLGVDNSLTKQAAVDFHECLLAENAVIHADEILEKFNINPKYRKSSLQNVIINSGKSSYRFLGGWIK